MVARLSKSLVGYYVALRISAGAATAWLPVEPRVDPSPIVRASTRTMVGGFDIREVVETAGRLHVVTLSANADVRAVGHWQHPILPN